MASDITGCEGHSKEKPLEECKVICSSCNEIVDRDKAFISKYNDKDCICFKCY